VNKCGPPISICQTVLPGNEDILIKNEVRDTLDLAVPGTFYWDKTSAQ
jgi:hypothetical protein